MKASIEAKRHKCYFNIFSLSVYLDNYSRKKKLIFQNCMTNVVKIDKIREELWRNHQNRNFSFRNFCSRSEPGIKNKELHDKESKIPTYFLYFYILKELSDREFVINS